MSFDWSGLEASLRLVLLGDWRVLSLGQYTAGHWRVTLIDRCDRWEAAEAETPAEAIRQAVQMMWQLPAPPQRWTPADCERSPGALARHEQSAEDLGL